MRSYVTRSSLTCILLVLATGVLGSGAEAKDKKSAKNEMEKRAEAVVGATDYFVRIDSEIGFIPGTSGSGRGGRTDTRRDNIKGGYRPGTKDRAERVEYYSGFLLPQNSGHDFYVISAGEGLAKDEEFKAVKVFFANRQKKAFKAQFVGADTDSTIMLFRLEVKSLPKSFNPPRLAEKPAYEAGQEVWSLGHPYSPQDKKFIFWQVKIGKLEKNPLIQLGTEYKKMAELGSFIAHESDLGDRQVQLYWMGGPLVREMGVEKKKPVFELLGMNLLTSKGEQVLALPIAKVLEIRDQIVKRSEEEAKTKDEDKDHNKHK